jgi:hypothetical protein
VGGPLDLRKRRRENFTDGVTDQLVEWVRAHAVDPYPSPAERQLLQRRTGLSAKQLNYWFSNFRRRQRLLASRMRGSPPGSDAEDLSAEGAPAAGKRSRLSLTDTAAKPEPPPPSLAPPLAPPVAAEGPRIPAALLRFSLLGPMPPAPPPH